MDQNAKRRELGMGMCSSDTHVRRQKKHEKKKREKTKKKKR